jgi:predicted transcriptional regulator of viral defense system
MREAVPRALTAPGPRVFRPRDLAGIWALPHKELARLETKGICRQVAHGYWLLAPLDAWGDDRWRPTIEGLGASLAAADFGQDNVAVANLGAARMLGVLPRARGSVDVVVPIRRHPTETEFGTIVFVCRQVPDLDVQLMTTDLGKAWVTTREQTLLDLARDPAAENKRGDVWRTIKTLATDADWDFLGELAARQRGGAALRRIRQGLKVAGAHH